MKKDLKKYIKMRLPDMDQETLEDMAGRMSLSLGKHIEAKVSRHEVFCKFCWIAEDYLGYADARDLAQYLDDMGLTGEKAA